MLTTTEYFLASEIAYRQDRIARDWAASRERRTRPRRPLLRLTRRSPLRLRGPRTRGATVA